MDKTKFTADYTKEIPMEEFLLNLLMQKFADTDGSVEPKERRGGALEAGKISIDYLKATNQYERQFELCLKTFEGSDSNSFNSDFEEAIKKLYQDHVTDLGDDLIKFSEENIHSHNYREFEVGPYEPPSFEPLYREYFFKYVENESPDGVEMRDPFQVRRIQLNTTSNTALKQLEGKLRTIGQFACIEETIRFIKIRIGLHASNKYIHKTLVKDLDELIEKLLIDTFKNEFKRLKLKRKPNPLLQKG